MLQHYSLPGPACIPHSPRLSASMHRKGAQTCTRADVSDNWQEMEYLRYGSELQVPWWLTGSCVYPALTPGSMLGMASVIGADAWLHGRSPLQGDCWQSLAE